MIDSKFLSNFTFHSVVSANIAAISGLMVGWHVSVPNMPQKIITTCTETERFNGLPACLPMSDSVWGLTVGTFALGGLVGSVGSGYLNNRFSRKTNIVIAGLWMILGGILSALSMNTAMYTIGRIGVGIAAGLSGSCVGIYVSEVSTASTRGALGCLYELFLNLGILLTQIAGLYMSTIRIWRYLWVIPTCLSSLQIVCLYLFCIESPRYLISKGKESEAKEAHETLFGTDLIYEPPLEEEEDGWGEIWKDRWIRRMIMVVTVIQIYNQVGGIGPMSIYSVGFLTTVFDGNTGTATTVTLLSSAAGVLATLISVLTMHKMGRKGAMLISTVGMTLGSVFLVIGSNVGTANQLAPLSITASILYIFAYSMGCGVIPWMIAPELLPLKALPIGSGIANASNWLINFIINTIWPSMNSGLGSYSFLVFAVINFIGILFVWFCMPETTGKSLDQLEMLKEKNESFEDIEKTSIVYVN